MPIQLTMAINNSQNTVAYPQSDRLINRTQNIVQPILSVARSSTEIA